jgi:hypothetical protein
MRRLLLLTAVVLLAGCSLTGGDDGASVEVGELKQLVLQPEDVDPAFLRFDEGKQGLTDLPGGRPAEQGRFGRQGGWKARYRRAGTRQTSGPLVIASLVDVFESTSGAKDEFETVQTELRDGELEWQPTDAPRLGDEAVAMSLTQGTGQTKVSFFLVAWRDDNAVASIEANGFGDKITLDDAVALARKQEERIARAAA